MSSIFHFFKSLVEQKDDLSCVGKLEDFPYDETLLSFKSIGRFPDMGIRLNSTSELFPGGELIELKDSSSYTVSSFNSTIPTGRKAISQIIQGQRSGIRQQMEHIGDDIEVLPIRDIFYLIRGKQLVKRKMQTRCKICLIHGSFFETVAVEQLIQEAFKQVLEERLRETGEDISPEARSQLLALLSKQVVFSRVRDVNKASVKLRFRVMTEVKPEGNILNARQYPQIVDNSLNLILPCENELEENTADKKMQIVFGTTVSSLRRFKIKHHLNGDFLVFQTSL